jgi:catechol 2,3-dioxygenase-like lactoylglutathione lyase family enzyme
MRVTGLHHVQLAMPAGGEDRARAFYARALGLSEVEKPANLRSRGGCWFESPGIRLHLGVEPGFRPAMKAHPALEVDDLKALVARLAKAGYPARADEPLPGFDRVYVADPFGNRIELLQPHGDGTTAG